MRSRALAAVTCIAISGCATVMNRGPNLVPVATNPPGAAVFVDGAFAGYSPTVVALDRTRGVAQISIAARGYVPVIVQRERGIDEWFWGNLLSFGWVGVVVDSMTGAIYGYDETPIRIDLMPLGPPCACPSDGPP